jgi:hypothetical protein
MTSLKLDLLELIRKSILIGIFPVACPFSSNEEFIEENDRCNMYPLEMLD